MERYITRWSVAAAWTVVIAVLWTFLAPQTVSATLLVVVWAAGMLGVFLGGAVMRDSQSPKSVGAILNDLETAKPPVSRRPS